MEWMRRRSLVICLNPPFDEVLATLEASLESRPMLKGKSGAELTQHVQRLMLTRAACYGAAHVKWSQSLRTDEAIDDALASIRWRLGPED